MTSIQKLYFDQILDDLQEDQVIFKKELNVG